MIDENLETVQETGEEETPSVPQSDTNQTPTEGNEDAQNPALPGTSETPTEERMVPYSALKEAREEIRKIKRDMARNSEPALPGADDQQIMEHPFVQSLLGKVADFELNQGVKDILERYPDLPKDVAKAIQRNPRGFVQLDTTDVPTGILDIEEYVQGIMESIQNAAAIPPQPTNVPVVNNNSSDTAKSKIDTEVAEIMKIPSEDWTPEQYAAVKKYSAEHSSRS